MKKNLFILGAVLCLASVDFTHANDEVSLESLKRRVERLEANNKKLQLALNLLIRDRVDAESKSKSRFAKKAFEMNSIIDLITEDSLANLSVSELWVVIDTLVTFDVYLHMFNEVPLKHLLDEKVKEKMKLLIAMFKGVEASKLIEQIPTGLRSLTWAKHHLKKFFGESYKDSGDFYANVAQKAIEMNKKEKDKAKQLLEKFDNENSRPKK